MNLNSQHKFSYHAEERHSFEVVDHLRNCILPASIIQREDITLAEWTPNTLREEVTVQVLYSLPTKVTPNVIDNSVNMQFGLSVQSVTNGWPKDQSMVRNCLSVQTNLCYFTTTYS